MHVAYIYNYILHKLSFMLLFLKIDFKNLNYQVIEEDILNFGSYYSYNLEICSNLFHQ